MNPRIQVEHTVTEMVTGIDIFISQILVAEGYPLNSPTIHIYSQNEVKCNGYACLLYTSLVQKELISEAFAAISG